MGAVLSGLTDRDIRCASAGWIAGCLATTTTLLASYLLWWRGERKRNRS